ncbi:hypothetical protein OGAPHI_006952 [Ogataea philodendri]|uniref:DOCKER domain-containing protein n=1 Tax=Ogataea philodendri TaxID=1378263 RepID=A0A9P8T095_9ASCO|nr:uncharacterized protein OGAPHI_006952 [Ogataea philodendri]KAH3660366.1 hypothetical protein OGAPHI_006952 [Ogataea philodendri]
MVLWSKLPNFRYGRVIESFLPLKNLDKSSEDAKHISQNFVNVYPGDRVFLFEAEQGGEWVRGYVVSLPMPSDFLTAMASLDKMPESRTCVAVLPTSCLEILKDIPLPKTPSGHTGPPPLPLNILSTESSYFDEIVSSLRSLAVYCYAVYSMNEFNLFNKLSEIFKELNDIRLSFLYDLLTNHEKTVAYQKSAVLVNKVSKLLVPVIKKDVGGYLAVFSRNEQTGQLFKAELEKPADSSMINLAKVAQNQIFSALASNFPVRHPNISYVPEKMSKFKPSVPSHIFVDFKSVVGSSTFVPENYDGLNAYMYLRNTKRQLTETFSVSIKPGQKMELANIPAAIFQNIPVSEVENTRVYLVAVLTENIRLDQTTLKVVRKGIAAGVANVTRMFSVRQGHLSTNESHHFAIKLFASYSISEDPMSPATGAGLNDGGWGDLVERIITGSTQGVAVNPRAEKLTLVIKELRNSNLDEDIQKTSDAVSTVRPMVFSPFEHSYDRTYLTLVQCHGITLKRKEVSFITVIVKSVDESVTFSRGANVEQRSSWQFISVSPNEKVQETVLINESGTTSSTRSDQMLIEVYKNGNYLGEGKFQWKSGSQVKDTSKKGHLVDIFGAGSSHLGSVELEIEYVGAKYNIDPHVSAITNWKESALASHPSDLIQALSDLDKVELLTVVKFFGVLLFNLLEIFNESVEKNNENLKRSSFVSIVHLLDIVLARQTHYTYLFAEFFTNYTQLPAIGEQLLELASLYFANVETDWNSTGRALCRASYPVLRIASAAASDKDKFARKCHGFSKAATIIIGLQKDSLVADQLLLVEALELWVDTFRDFCDDQTIVGFVCNWLEAIGLRGLASMNTPSLNALASKKKANEHRLIVAKMLFIRRLLDSWLLTSGSIAARDELVSSSLKWALEVIVCKKVDLDVIRLALGIILSVDTASFGSERVFVDDSSQLYAALFRMIPTLAETFYNCLEYSQENDLLQPRRTFTQLFPTEFPFTEHTFDSAVSDEVFSEVLIELAILISIHSKIAKGNSSALLKLMATKYISPAFEKLSPLIGASGNHMQSPTRPFDTMIWIATIFSSRYYPSEKWFSLQSIITEGILSLTEVVYPLSVQLVPTLDKRDLFNIDAWHKYLTSILHCGIAQTSSLEHLFDIPRKCCFLLTGDIRTRTATLLETIWGNLGQQASMSEFNRFGVGKYNGFQPLFIVSSEYSLVQQILLLCLQRNDKCLEVGVNMVWSMIVAEWSNKKNFEELRRSCILSLYEIFHKETGYYPGSEEIVSFVTKLTAKVTLTTQDEAYEPIMELIKTLCDYFENLIGLQSIPKGDDFDDDRMYYQLRLSHFLLKEDRPEVFQSFVNDLYESSLEKENYVQAALSLGLLADTYTWDTETVVEACEKPKFPRETVFKRKEHLYKLIASNLVKGKRPEQAVEIYQELLDSYYNYNFDLMGLSHCHGELAMIYKALQTVDRVESTYFRIAFVGSGFPDSLRDKDFIYEGMAYEHITSMGQRLSRLYPGTHLIGSEDHLQRLKDEQPTGKYAHIKVVSPVKELSKDKLSFMTKQYMDNKNVRQFQAVRRLPGSKGVEDLWTEEVSYETYTSFPTLMNRSEVKETKVVRLSPLENALRSLTDKNEHLQDLQYKAQQAIKDNADLSGLSESAMFSEISRVVAGAVDSPVNGGAGQYRVFFSHETVEGLNELVQQQFWELVKNLFNLLKLHGALVPEQLFENHKTLVELFSSNFKKELDLLDLQVKDAMDMEKLREIIFASSASDSALSLNLTPTNSNVSIHSDSLESRFSQNLSITGVRLLSKNNK